MKFKIKKLEDEKNVKEEVDHGPENAAEKRWIKIWRKNIFNRKKKKGKRTFILIASGGRIEKKRIRRW